MSIYDYKVKDIEQNEVSLEEYRGKVLLIVNTATGCGFTPQYEGLRPSIRNIRTRDWKSLIFPAINF